MKDAILTVAHGTVENLDDLPPFLAAIRRGHAAPPELLAEVRRRYEAIGGRSPLNDICREVTRKLGERLGLPSAFAGRMWAPSPESALRELYAAGATRIVVLPLAQHSAPLYVETVQRSLRDLASEGLAGLEVIGTPNWGQEEALTQAFAASLTAALERLSQGAAPRATRVLFTAHSLPMAVLRGGDPYEREVRASAASVASAAGGAMPAHEVIFQSQGMSGGDWLGPDVKSTLDRLKQEGVQSVLFAPIGFLADHVEVLYDLDIEARSWAEERGMTYARTASLNASEGLLDALTAVARQALS